MTKNSSSHVDQEDQAALGSLPALDPQSDQSISLSPRDGVVGRSTGPGLKPQASSLKPQASSSKLKELQASSGKRQVLSSKLQAPSRKQQVPIF